MLPFWAFIARNSVSNWFYLKIIHFFWLHRSLLYPYSVSSKSFWLAVIDCMGQMVFARQRRYTMALHGQHYHHRVHTHTHTQAVKYHFEWKKTGGEWRECMCGSSASVCVCDCTTPEASQSLVCHRIVRLCCWLPRPPWSKTSQPPPPSASHRTLETPTQDRYSR